MNIVYKEIDQIPRLVLVCWLGST